MTGKATLLTFAVAAFAGSAHAYTIADLRAIPSTKTWDCRAAVSVGDYVMPGDRRKPVVMRLLGHHGNDVGFIDMKDLPAIETKFRLKGLFLAWTWDAGSSVVYLNPGTGVATHHHSPNDGTAAVPDSSYHCKRTDGAAHEAGDSVVDTDADAISRQVVPPSPPLTVRELEAFGLAVGNCWSAGSLSTSARATKVVVAFAMHRNGVPDTASIRMVDFVDGSEADAAEAFEAARHAIIRCGTQGFRLPIEKYDWWREVEVTFNAEGMQFR